MFNARFSPVTNTGTWVETIEIKSTEDGSLVDCSPFEFTVSIRETDGCTALLRKTTEDGVITPSIGYLQWRFEDLSGLSPGTYEVGLTVIDGPDKVDFIIGTLPVFQGF